MLPIGVTILRNAADAHFECHGGRPGRNHPAVYGDLALGRCVGAGEDVGERRLAVAGDAGDAGDLAREKIEGDARKAGLSPSARGHDVSQRQARGTRAGRIDDGLGQRAADHQGRELGPCRTIRRPLADQPAAAQHHDAVAGGEDLVELVRNEDDRQASRHEHGEGAKQRLRLARRQHRRRLVEDEDARIAIERLEDLDALALAHSEAADGAIGVDGEAEILAEPGDSLRRVPRLVERQARERSRCRARCSRARSGSRPA